MKKEVSILNQNIKSAIREYYEKFHAHKSNNLGEIDQFPERYKLLKLTQGTDNMKSLYLVNILKIELQLKIFQKIKLQTHMVLLVNSTI